MPDSSAKDLNLWKRGLGRVPEWVWERTAAETLVLLVAAVNLVILRFMVMKQVRRRFPDASTRGLTSYTMLRALQLRFLRMPKPQVKIGQTLPDTYH